MDRETEKSGWKIWLYLTPVYIIVAIPLVKWTMKINSSDVDLSKDEYKAFNSQEGEIKKSRAVVYSPDLDESGYSLHYRSGKNSAARTQNITKEQEYKSFGSSKGFLTRAVGKAMNNPKAVNALFSNSLVVSGFMERDTVKSALGSAQSLRNYLLNTAAVNNFSGNSTVKAALANPQTVNAVASSSLISAILNSPAARDLMKDPDSMNDILASNPRITRLINGPNVMNALMNNPKTAGAARKLRLGAAKN